MCLAEWTLASLEGLLATSLDAGMFTHAQDFSLSISVDKNLAGKPEYGFEKAHGTEMLTIRHSQPGLRLSPSDADARFVQKIILEILPRIALPRNVQQYGHRVLGREEGFSRAITFSNPVVPLNNILGERIVTKVSEWRADQNPVSFPPRRELPWSHGVNLQAPRERASVFENLGEGEPPSGLLDFSAVKHSDVRVFSMIDLPLWDKAGWHGVAFGHTADLSEPPVMSFVFRNAEVAREIFQGWRAKLGEVDVDEQLHLSIITGVSSEHPHSYTVVISSNPPAAADTEGVHHTVHVSRVHRMDPPDSRNLNVFLPRYERIGQYFLMPAHYALGMDQPEFLDNLWIGKRALRIIPAWKIGRNDPDCAGIGPDDDPIIPEGINNAPVLGIFERRKARTASSDGES